MNLWKAGNPHIFNAWTNKYKNKPILAAHFSSAVWDLCFISTDAPPEVYFSSLLVLACRGADVTEETEPLTVVGVNDPTRDKPSVRHSALLLLILLFTLRPSALCVLFLFPRSLISLFHSLCPQPTSLSAAVVERYQVYSSKYWTSLIISLNCHFIFISLLSLISCSC